MNTLLNKGHAQSRCETTKRLNTYDINEFGGDVYLRESDMFLFAVPHAAPECTGVPHDAHPGSPVGPPQAAYGRSSTSRQALRRAGAPTQSHAHGSKQQQAAASLASPSKLQQVLQFSAMLSNAQASDSKPNAVSHEFLFVPCAAFMKDADCAHLP